jgi:hypothetical protein
VFGCGTKETIIMHVTFADANVSRLDQAAVIPFLDVRDPGPDLDRGAKKMLGTALASLLESNDDQL